MKLTVVSAPEESGEVTVEPVSADHYYYPADNVTLTAVARPGYVFNGWSGDVSEIEDPGSGTIVVELNRYYIHNVQKLQIVANFAREESFPWKWLAIGLGAGLLVVAALGLMLFRMRAAGRPGRTEGPA